MPFSDSEFTLAPPAPPLLWVWSSSVEDAVCSLDHSRCLQVLASSLFQSTVLWYSAFCSMCNNFLQVSYAFQYATHLDCRRPGKKRTMTSCVFHTGWPEFQTLPGKDHENVCKSIKASLTLFSQSASCGLVDAGRTKGNKVDTVLGSGSPHSMQGKSQEWSDGRAWLRDTAVSVEQRHFPTHSEPQRPSLQLSPPCVYKYSNNQQDYMWYINIWTYMNVCLYIVSP